MTLLNTNCPSCHLAFSVPDSLAGQNIVCPGCRTEFPLDANSSSPTSAPSPDAFQKAQDIIKQFASGATVALFAESEKASRDDSVGVAGMIGAGVSGGLLLVGLCFTPFACCAVPVSIGGMVASVFAKNKELWLIGFFGNGFVLLLSLAITVWISFSHEVPSESFSGIPTAASITIEHGTAADIEATFRNQQLASDEEMARKRGQRRLSAIVYSVATVLVIGLGATIAILRFRDAKAKNRQRP